jgi:D-glycerate 3-kinase
VDRDQRLDELPEWQKGLLRRHKLDPAYLASAQYWFDPLGDSCVSHQIAAGRPVLIAVNGSQGSGKSTLCAYLEMLIAAKYQLQVVTLSLDDFYYTREHRINLSQEVHSLLATRGVPGTHDMVLLASTLDALLDPDHNAAIDIPRFDKARDDRRPEWERLTGPVDIVLLEGWCLGARPQAIDELVEPINALEEEEDPDGVWRNYVNAALARDFLPLYSRIDQWIMLQAPGFDCVLRWRSEQEQKLARGQGTSVGKRVMNEEQLARFIQFYQRLTEACLKELPLHVHHLYELDEARGVKAVQHRA